MNQLYDEIEKLLNIIVESMIRFNTREERLNFIANQYGWDEKFGKYFPNNFSRKNSIEIPFKHHPFEKELILDSTDNYEILIFSFLKNQKNKLDLIFKELYQRWLTKLGKEYFLLKWNLLDSTFKDSGWIFKNYVIGLRQSNELNSNGEFSLRFYVYEFENFSLEKHKEKRGIKKLNRLYNDIGNIIDISIELMNNDLHLERVQNGNLQRVKFAEDESYQFQVHNEEKGYLECVTFEESIKKEKNVRINLFESIFYNKEGKEQIVEILTEELADKFDQIKTPLIREENVEVYGSWIFNDYLIELKEVNIPHEYVSTMNIFLMKNEDR